MSFSFSGDYEWARWETGVDCAECRRDNFKVHQPAIGCEVHATDHFIHVEPVCEKHAVGKNVLLFKENN